MSTFVLVHAAGDSGWAWHLVEAELRALGHEVVAPDLPCEDDTAGLPEYADAVIAAVGDRTDLVVVGHSLGGFTAPLVADRLPTRVLVYLTGMVPQPGERPGDWWANVGYAEAVAAQGAIDGGLTGHDDPYIAFLHDVPRPLAEEAMRRTRGQSGTPMEAPWPLDAHPDVPTRFVLCTADRFFPPSLMRRVAADRLNVEPDELDAAHCAPLSRPKELAVLLDGYVASTPT